ncbi:MAG TPA: GMC family oxidoreductase, partial [Micropepsaceae bacterium]|nr:GMC family oxidoreductase [Micropepsaceae bacterium]
YREAASLCQLGPMAFDDPAFWQKQPGGQSLTTLPLDAKRFRTAIFQISPPTRFGKVYAPALTAAQNVNVMLDATVLELLPAAASRAEQGRKAIGEVRVATKGNNKTFTVSAPLFVVATGGIEAARLLLLSDKVYPAGAGNENDLVGRYFMDHPWMTESAYLRFAKDGVKAPLYFENTSLANARIFATITASPELLEQEHIGGFRILLAPSRVSTAGADSVRTLMGDLRHGTVPPDLSEHLSNILSDFDVLADSAYKTVTGSKKGWLGDETSGPYKGAFIDLNFEQRPNRDSRVVLDNALDANGQRRVRVDWRLNETDKRTATRALDLVAHEFGRIGLGRTRIRLDLANGAPWPRELMGSDHHSGTARMAENPKMGVVDGNCRVHSTTNLYVAGSATFPTNGYANPTLTIVALAARLADHLQSKLS